MITHQRDGVFQRFLLGDVVGLPVLAMQRLQVQELRQQTFAQIARAHAHRIQLLDQVDGFHQCVAAERHTRRHRATWHQVRTRVGVEKL